MAEAQKICQECNQTITPQDIVQRRAGLIQGKLLCASCVEMKRRVAMQARATSQAERASAAPPAPAAVAARGEVEEEPISLVSEDEMPSSKSQMIRSFAEGSTLGGSHHDEGLKRPIGGPQDAATRVRTFHCKLTDAGLANLDDIVNNWLDDHPNIFIKNVSSSIGVFESKTKEAHLFVNVFY